jgi:phage terminase small subunit
MPRPRKPTTLLELAGVFDRNPARRRVDPEISGALGKPPKHLDVERRKVWLELSKLLPLGVARNADRFSYELICDLMYRQRYQSITGAELGSLVSLLSKFGRDPSSRAKVATPVSTKSESNPFLEFTAS